jgi:hypothetical protein
MRKNSLSKKNEDIWDMDVDKTEESLVNISLPQTYNVEMLKNPSLKKKRFASHGNVCELIPQTLLFGDSGIEVKPDGEHNDIRFTYTARHVNRLLTEELVVQNRETATATTGEYLTTNETNITREELISFDVGSFYSEVERSVRFLLKFSFCYIN